MKDALRYMLLGVAALSALIALVNAVVVALAQDRGSFEYAFALWSVSAPLLVVAVLLLAVTVLM